METFKEGPPGLDSAEEKGPLALAPGHGGPARLSASPGGLLSRSVHLSQELAGWWCGLALPCPARLRTHVPGAQVAALGALQK